MQEMVDLVLRSVRERYADSRENLFEIEVGGFSRDLLMLRGRVLDQGTLTAAKQALKEALPRTRTFDANVRVLRVEAPLMRAVATNLTGLYREPSFGAENLSEVLWGMPLEVLAERESWCFVRQPDGYLGWVYKPYLMDNVPAAPTYLVIAPEAVLRSEPKPDGKPVGRLLSGMAVRPGETAGDWVRVAINREGWVPWSSLRALSDLPRTPQAQRAQMVEDGMRLKGVPYRWGGCTANGIDCSGLAQLLHRWVGIVIRRDADMQCRDSKPVEPPFQPGDLLFFGDKEGDDTVTHVAVSIGGWNIIHSSRSRNGVYVDSVQEVDSLRRTFIRAGTFIEDGER